LALLPAIDYLVASERFARDFTGEDDLEKAFNALKRQAPSVVVTLGERGLKGRNGSSEGRLPAFPIEAVDTTGAGDTFHGAFALELARGAGFVSALVFASAAAALSCRSLGARPGIPTRRAVQEFLNQQRTLPTLPWRVAMLPATLRWQAEPSSNRSKGLRERSRMLFQTRLHEFQLLSLRKTVVKDQMGKSEPFIRGETP